MVKIKIVYIYKLVWPSQSPQLNPTDNFVAAPKKWWSQEPSIQSDVSYFAKKKVQIEVYSYFLSTGITVKLIQQTVELEDLKINWVPHLSDFNW